MPSNTGRRKLAGRAFRNPEKTPQTKEAMRYMSGGRSEARTKPIVNLFVDVKERLGNLCLPVKGCDCTKAGSRTASEVTIQDLDGWQASQVELVKADSTRVQEQGLEKHLYYADSSPNYDQVKKRGNFCSRVDVSILSD